jgi:hypothetical protein
MQQNNNHEHSLLLTTYRVQVQFTQSLKGYYENKMRWFYFA